MPVDARLARTDGTTAAEPATSRDPELLARTRREGHDAAEHGLSAADSEHTRSSTHSSDSPRVREHATRDATALAGENE